MVTIELYVIRDITADDIGPVFQAKNVGVALRQFRNVLKGLNPNISTDEFELWRIGYLTDKMELIPELQLCVDHDTVAKMSNANSDTVSNAIDNLDKRIEKNKLKEVKNNG